MSNSSWLIDAVDDCARRSFHEDIDSWFNWFLVFTAVVVVGLLMEGVEYLPTGKVQVDPNTGVPRVRWRSIQCRHWLISWGWLLVVIGVAGELGSEWMASAYEGKLRTLNEILTLSAREEIAELYLEAANASKDAEIAKKQAAEANLRTEELRAQVQHRRLRREQKAKIREVLKGAPKYLVTVVGMPLDNESLDFRDDLFLAIKEQWVGTLNGFWIGRRRGVSIGTIEASRPTDGIRLLSRALKAAAIPHEEITLDANDKTIAGETLKRGVMYLFVGPRPAPK